MPVIAGAGSNNTAEAIDLARHAEKAGADARAGRHALLQQAQPGRALPALQGDQRRDRHPDHHLQHSAALGDRHVGRHDGAAVRAAEHRRRQGRDRQARRASASSALRWGRTSSSSRARMSTALGFMAHRRRSAASRSPPMSRRALSEFQEACLAGDFAQRARLSGPADAAAHGAVHRAESGAASNMRSRGSAA